MGLESWEEEESRETLRYIEGLIRTKGGSSMN